MPKNLYTEIIRPNQKWSWVIERGNRIVLTDLDGDSNISMLVYNSENTIERYNMPDTLKIQHTSHLTKGHCIYSDMGRILFSIVEDSLGWHDTICGVLTNEETEAKYGPSSYQELRNNFHRSGRQNLLVEMAKNGLTKKDFGPCLNWFSKVWVDEEGNINYAENHSIPNSSVTLRAEMDCLVVLTNTPHPLNPSSTWKTGPISIQIQDGELAGPEDICRKSYPENERGFQNTENYFKTKGGHQ